MIRIDGLEIQLRGFEAIKRRLRSRLDRALKESNEVRRRCREKAKESRRLKSEAEQLKVFFTMVFHAPPNHLVLYLVLS
jgi:hypothetical protein